MSTHVAISSILKATIDEKLTDAKSSVWRPACTFINSEKELTITPTRIFGMTIEQSFMTNYMDVVSISVELTANDFISLLENYQDLKCSIIIHRYSPYLYGVMTNEPPDIFEYKVIISDAKDILKKFNPAELKKTKENPNMEMYESARLPLTVQLVDEVAYNLRQVQINAMLKDVTMEDTINFVMSAFKTNDTAITQIDNTDKFKQISIPPMKNISNIFSFLQNRYGVYTKGIAHYYSDKKFHLFKSFDTEADYPSTINIYNIPEKMYDGCDSYHSTDGEDVHIVSNSKVITKSISEETVENSGNASAITQSDSVMDASREVQKDGTVKLAQQNSIVVKDSTNNAASKDLNVVKYHSTTSNIYLEASQVALANLELVSCGWIHGRPKLIQPGHKVVYHYDDNNKYSTAPGIMHYIKYDLVPFQKPDHDYVFRWDVSFMFAIKPKDKK